MSSISIRSTPAGKGWLAVELTATGSQVTARMRFSAPPDWSAKAAQTLAGFPKKKGDRRKLELGQFTKSVDDGVRLDLECVEANGASRVTVFARESHESESASLFFIAARASVEAFVDALSKGAPELTLAGR